MTSGRSLAGCRAQLPRLSASRLRAERLRWAATLASVIVYVLFVLNAARNFSPYTQNVLLVTAVFVILAISLNISAGMAGLYSLGHAALFAVGAYLTAVLAAHSGVSVFLLLPISVVGTALVGGVVGALSFRVSGLYFAITTFVLSLLTTVLINRIAITGSYAGLIGPNFPGFPTPVGALGNSLVWAGAVCVSLAYFVARSLRASPAYPVLLSIRDAEPLAHSIGVSPRLTRVGVFMLSAVLAGLAGWLFSFLGVVSPGQFDWTVSVNILVMVILGGINTTWGPILGAVFINLFNAYVNISPLWRQTLFGALFVLTIVLVPEGLVGLIGRAWARRPASSRSPEVTTETADGAAGRLRREGEAAAASQPRPPRLRSASPGAAITCRDLSYRYTRGAYALHRLDLTVERGTIHGLIGPNGSGKSTLLNVISGHLTPETGTVNIAGHPLERRPASARAGVGLRRTFQTATLVGELTNAETPVLGLYRSVRHAAVRSPLWLALPGRRQTSRRLADRSRAALRRVGILPRWDGIRVKDSPHGVQQLLQLATASAAEPAILLLDEPVAGLTTVEVEETANVLRQLRDGGTTIVVVEHHTSFVFALCDAVTVLHAGELVTTGAPTDVRAHQAVREVYLGTP